MAVENPDCYPLKADFRYFHEPIPEELSSTWVVGRDSVAQELADRVMFSRGGAFLVSGLRGVGKTTCVRLAIQLIRIERDRYARRSGDLELVDVWINLARPLDPVQLLHHLIRHLYLRLKETGLLNRLDPELRSDLNTAFLRTSFEISSRTLIGEERSRSAEFGTGKIPWIGLEFLGKVASSFKQSKSDEEALKYLPYDEKAAEFDILNFSRRLLDEKHGLSTQRRRWWQWFRRAGVSIPRVKVVFVLDELDKLEPPGEKAGRSPLDPILQALKTVFSASGFAFVFIGGKEVEERLLEDASQGDSIYESIFAYDLYLPCLWNEQRDIIARCFESKSRIQSDADTVALYLRYKGRGVPRRTWRELNKHVLWTDAGPVLTLDLERRRYMRVFAKLEEALEGQETFRRMPGGSEQVQSDRQRLCFYYTIDWIFSRAHEAFSVRQVTDVVSRLNLGRGHGAGSPDMIAQKVIEMLLSRAFIEKADRERIVIGQSQEGNLYRLAPWVLLAFQGTPEKQSIPDEVFTAPPPPPWEAEFDRIGRYRVIRKIGEGGFAAVYMVGDIQDRTLAAKVLRLDAASPSTALAMFEREVDILRKLNHPDVLRVYDTGEEKGRPYFIMDLLQGISLRQLLDNVKRISPDYACVLTRHLAEVFGYIHDRGYVRLDIKPSNIFLTNDDQMKVIDFGIAMVDDDGKGDYNEGSSPKIELRAEVGARRSGTVDHSTIFRYVIGTPAYMAPEQAQARRVDSRSDIFSLGVVLFEMLTGFLPSNVEGSLALSQLLDVPAELKAAVSRALAKNPEDRFQTMDEFSSAINHLATTDIHDVIANLRSLEREGMAVTKEDTHQVSVMIPVFQPASKAEEATDFQALFPKTDSTKEEPLDGARIRTLDGAKPTIDKLILEVDEALKSGAVVDIVRLLRSSESDIQEYAFDALCRIPANQNGRWHLLFDFLFGVCLWGGPDAGVVKRPLTAESLKLGRSASEVDLPLQDPSVSRQHVAFFASMTGVEVEDLSSANGTLRNGVPCRREKLSDGDFLRLGRCEIVIHILSRDRTITRRSI